ncbi:aspartyl-tRNA(Asn)/glutamyl-tRNA(Gln) amidotransferase subunit A [Sulfitobacter undariae]|uniref:Aspartyl-tRNA(Asn)/glutamyl-tRNA(Gln) amidotransferase subunit A n=1 Tax=Sulfitobacter undariae TaxID=1563671 RepID=A0A7W6E6V1_9RHOB|nr:amidase family protein [Sulfitobacter undariae]MBB3995841.1 aspartyl-tRNA(Asn)/glutamyl-tRNA(Gln) amidotransferase subunit A [Sulfitobacter undariae]
MTKVTLPDFTQSFAPAPIPQGPLNGLRAGIKDLFDVAGYVTKAGSKSRATLPAATQDAPTVALLRAAGAELVGHNNMTEFAYSGLGLNPHFGTPMTPLIEGAIAGGSTSGGAAAVAKGDVDFALGTDTGGSLRIPAAFCGVAGLKPTAASVSSEGAVPLSTTLDSVGAIAKDVETLRRVYAVLAAQGPQDTAAVKHLVVPENFGMDQLEEPVLAAFESALSVLESCGFTIERRAFDFLETYKKLPIWHFSAVESRVHHSEQYAQEPNQIDPKVKLRMLRADTASAVDYAKSLALRAAIVKDAQQEIGQAAIVLPTVAILPPQLSTLDDDESFDRINLLALRNTTLANVIDGCSISLPIPQTPGAGLMITAPAWRDLALLDAATLIEPELTTR